MVTGVSGAGKSSLAFDTLYAEGQRRYVETFSPYTRQFLEKLDKPDADRIDGIPPAIAVGQLAWPPLQPKHGRHDHRDPRLPRLALRPGRRGHLPQLRPARRPRVPGHRLAGDRGLARRNALRDRLSRWMSAPRPTGRPCLRSLRAEGFTRLRVDGQPSLLDDPDLALPDDELGRRHRRPPGPGQRPARAARSTRSKRRSPRAWAGAGSWPATSRGPTSAAGGAAGAGPITSSPSRTCSGTTAPWGPARPARASGRTMELDLGRIVPDPSKTIREGARRTLDDAGYRGFLEELLAQSPALDIPVDVPFQRLTPSRSSGCSRACPARGFTGLEGFFQGSSGKSYKLQRPGLPQPLAALSDLPGCHGARLRPEALAVKIEGRDIAELSAMTIRDARSFIWRAGEPAPPTGRRPECWRRSRAGSATSGRSGSTT